MNEEYTFKKLSDVETVENPSDGATVVGFNNGEAAQFPIGSIGGGVFVIDPSSPDFSQYSEVYGNKVVEALLSGKSVWLFNPPSPDTSTTSASTSTTANNFGEYYLAMSFDITPYTLDQYKITLYFEVHFYDFVFSGSLKP